MRILLSRFCYLKLILFLDSKLMFLSQQAVGKHSLLVVSVEKAPKGPWQENQVNSTQAPLGLVSLAGTQHLKGPCNPYLPSKHSPCEHTPAEPHLPLFVYEPTACCIKRGETLASTWAE